MYEMENNKKKPIGLAFPEMIRDLCYMSIVWNKACSIIFLAAYRQGPSFRAGSCRCSFALFCGSVIMGCLFHYLGWCCRGRQLGCIFSCGGIVRGLLKSLEYEARQTSETC
jgi:hypothetical protein